MNTPLHLTSHIPLHLGLHPTAKPPSRSSPLQLPAVREGLLELADQTRQRRHTQPRVRTHSKGLRLPSTVPGREQGGRQRAPSKQEQDLEGGTRSHDAWMSQLWLCWLRWRLVGLGVNIMMHTHLEGRLGVVTNQPPHTRIDGKYAIACVLHPLKPHCPAGRQRRRPLPCLHTIHACAPVWHEVQAAAVLAGCACCRLGCVPVSLVDGHHVCNLHDAALDHLQVITTLRA